jgi:uncharacterized protein (DUF736 family)
MAFEEKDGQGALFKNTKSTNERAPQYRGTCTIGGKRYQISAWIKEPKNGGDKFMSLKLEPYREPGVPDPDPSNGNWF